MNKVFLNMASGHRMSGAVSTLPKSVTQGWNYQPGTYRCDRGWNDETGKSYGCREPGARDVNGEWLCHMHADEVPSPTETVYRTCPHHRATFDLPPRFGVPGQWYWCSPKNHEPHEWKEEGRSPWTSHRSTVGIGLALAYGITLMISLMVVAAFWLHEYRGLTDEAALGFGCLIGFLSWFVAMWATGHILRVTAHAAELAWRYVWGDPL